MPFPGYFIWPGATLLRSKGKIWVSEQVIKENDQFTHKSSDGDLSGFTGGFEALIKVLEHSVSQHGVQGAHVEQ